MSDVGRLNASFFVDRVEFVNYIKEPDEITELLGHNYLINDYTDEVNKWSAS